MTLLLEKNEPEDNDIDHYRRTIDKELNQMLNVRKDVFAKKWYKDRIRKSFDDYPEFVENLVSRLKRGPQGTMERIFDFTRKLIYIRMITWNILMDHGSYCSISLSIMVDVKMDA